MRVLAIETSTYRGSVAILDAGVVVRTLEHRQPSAHAELILPLIGRLLEEAGWARTSLDRIGVGVGPGSFVGLRVGIALAEGIGMGLRRPVVGVPSLRAMLRAVPQGQLGTRVAMVDARRAEIFLTAADEQGCELQETEAILCARVPAVIEALRPTLVVGEVAVELGVQVPILRGPELDLPHAAWIGVLAGEQDPELAPPLPLYVRGAGATLPKLRPSPLRNEPRSG